MNAASGIVAMYTCHVLQYRPMSIFVTHVCDQLVSAVMWLDVAAWLVRGEWWLWGYRWSWRVV